MIEIKCDFCGKSIIIKTNKGGKEIPFRLEENICDECKGADLEKTWEVHQAEREKEWGIIIFERHKFFEALLKHQKKEWTIQKKKEHFGSFFDKNKNGGK